MLTVATTSTLNSDYTQIAMNTAFYCKECDLSFSKKFNFNSHCQRKHGNYVCRMCSTSFKYKNDLDEHIKHCDLKYYCDKCTFSTASKKRLSNHILIHRREENSNIVQRESDEHGFD